MDDPTLAVDSDSFNTHGSPPVPYMGIAREDLIELGWLPRPPATEWRDDVRRICDAHGLTVEAIERDDHHRPVTHCRFEVMARLRTRGWSTPKIGVHVGGRDHTTVMHGLKRFAVLVAEGKITPLIF